MSAPGEIDDVILELAEELSRVHVAVRVLDAKVSLALRKLGSSVEDIEQLQEGAETQLKTVLRQRFMERLRGAAEKSGDS